MQKLSSSAPVVTQEAVAAFEVSPDRSWVAYRLASGGLHAHSAGGQTFTLSASGQLVESFAISPDSTRAVFTARAGPPAPLQLFAADGVGGPVRLNAPLPLGGSVREGVGRFQISPDSRWVYYVADQDVAGPWRLHRAPIDGLAPPVPLTPLFRHAGPFLQLPGGAELLFLGEQRVGIRELFLVPADGSASAALLSAPLDSGFQALVGEEGLQLSPDGRRVAYRVLGDGRTELFSAPLDRSAPAVRLNDPMPALGQVRACTFTPDGLEVLHVTDLTGDGSAELYRVPSDGSASPVRVDGGVGGVLRVAVAPDGQRLVFLAHVAALNSTQLFGLALAGGAPVRLSSDLGPALVGDQGVQFDFQLGRDSRHAVYRAARDATNRYELYSVPLDGSAAPRELNDPVLSTGSVQSLQLAANGHRVVYRGDLRVRGQHELFTRAVDGSLPARLLSPALTGGGGVAGDFRVVAEEFVLFRADANERERVELFAAPVVGDGPATLASGEHPQVLGAPEVGAFALSPDERWVAYVEGTTTTFFASSALRSVPLSSPGSGLRISTGLAHPDGPVFGPDSQRVFFNAYGVEFDLFAAPIEGGGAPVFLAAEGTPDFVPPRISLSPDGEYVLGQWFKTYPSNVASLTLAPADGSRPARSLGGSFQAALSGSFTPDGTRVVVLSGANGVETLHVERVDGATPGHELSPVDFDVDAYALAGDDVVLFVGAPEGSAFDALYAVPTSGGAPLELSTPLTSVAGFVLTPERTQALYAADPGGPSLRMLLRVPIDGSQAPLAVVVPSAIAGDTYAPSGDFVVTPDGTRVVFLAHGQLAPSGRQELFSAPMDGSLAEVRLSAPFPSSTGGIVGGFRLSPDGRRVVYLADPEVHHRYELFSAPVDGSAPAVRLSGVLVGGQSLEPDYQLLADSSGVVFRADLALEDRVELWLAPLDGRRAPRRVSARMFADADVRAGFVLDRAGQWVYYAADAEVDGRMELFRHPLRATPRAAPR